MKKIEKKVLIMYIERLNNSKYGNPRYKIGAIDEEGWQSTYKTATDSIAGYQISTDMLNNFVTLVFHKSRTRKNKIIDLIITEKE